MALSSLFYLSTSLYKFMLTYAALSHQYEVGGHRRGGRRARRARPARSTRSSSRCTARRRCCRGSSAGIGALDYPQDEARRQAAAARRTTTRRSRRSRRCDLPPHFKHRRRARRAAEDEAEGVQLRTAAGRRRVRRHLRRRGPPGSRSAQEGRRRLRARPTRSVTCIQAKLNYFNRDQNLLTRWFTTEYSMWFDLLLPGLRRARTRRSRSAAPRTTSSRDRCVDLARLGPVQRHRGRRPRHPPAQGGLQDGDDRLDDARGGQLRRSTTGSASARAGSRATSRPGSCTCATRSGCMRQVGFSSWSRFQMVVGGTFIFLLNPIFWALTTLFFFTRGRA